MTYDPGTNMATDWDLARRVRQRETIRTISGRYVNLIVPDPADIDINDIAHGLAMFCRYGGHVAAHYSVAEHSLNVAAQLHRMFGDDALTLAGLLHDASEAYLGDVVRPLKHSDGMVGYREAEARMEAVIAVRFNLTMTEDPRLKTIDNEILPWEMAMIRDSRVRVAPDPIAVRRAFIDAFCEHGGDNSIR